MPHISGQQADFFHQAVEWFRQNLMPEFCRTLDENLPSGVTRVGELADVYAAADSLKEECTFTGHRFADMERPAIELPEELVPCLKRILIAKRRHEANLAEVHKEKTHNPKVIEGLEKEVRRMDQLLELPWLKSALPMKMPRITDFLSIESIQHGFLQADQLSDREYDEKFHILQAPKLLVKDLRYYRGICDSRRTSVVVAYLDIDDFKRFNTKYSEIQIDRCVLPLFMRTVEELVFLHGHAYRYGGDEYMVLLPNLSKPFAVSFLDGLRLAVSSTRYPEIEETTTVSIGFCYVDADCPLTDREIEKTANRAKNFAKASGKNRIATYTDNNFLDGDLRIVGS